MTQLAAAIENTESMEQIGEYLVRRLIGEGGMGKVYEAEERLSKRRVALKVLHAELSKSEQARKLFMNEMQILAHLEHPNVVRSLASIEVGGELVMVLEFLDGRTLRSVIAERGRLAWVDAVAVVASSASALAAAHGQAPPIIHRDLKPENIMVLSDGSIKVMDFGIAKVIEAMNQTNTQSVGTLQYMSPEQIDAHTIDHRSDLYCLGLILYELLEGRPPFTSSSPRQLLNLQCTAEPPPLSEDVRRGLPKGIEQLLFELLEKAPEDRPYLAEDIVERLEPFIPDAATGLATQSPRSPKPGQKSGRTPINGRSSGPRASLGATDLPDSGGAQSPRRAESARAIEPEKPADDPKPVPRADTIALIERGDKPREVPTAIAVAIIVALSLLAGIGAYAIRAARGSAAPSATTSASVAPKAPAPSSTARRSR
jgi:serine/threonine protein kinase